MSHTMKINHKTIHLTGEERNLLEVIQQAGITIPTFCYHSELSVYGACRMCLVEDDRGMLLAACSTKPAPGMDIQTHSPRIQKMRRMIIELLLANHHQDCTVCEKSGHCKLQQLAEDLGVHQVRFNPRRPKEDIDRSSLSVVRNANKCILCGDCVRMCSEAQGIGVLGFVNRGPKATVAPAFEKPISEVECINCGQCVAVCPTGALVVRNDTEQVWEALHTKGKTVIAEIAPAVRVAVGEEFGLKEGDNDLHRAVAALRLMGFQKIFDTSFTADLTVVEESTEFLHRLEKKEHLPQFTSCCPGWVTYAERYCPDMLPNLSSCRSPQQMFGSLAKKHYAKQLGIKPEDLIVVSIMPCTAKKFECKRPEFSVDGVPDVDYVLTTQELARMIRQMGIRFVDLAPEALDMPFGFFTGAGVIFGASGGVAEAALRFAAEKVTGKTLEDVQFQEVRGLEGIKEAAVAVGPVTVKLAVVSGLANAQKVIEKVRNHEVSYDLIEVMACPGGCIGGGGQPVPNTMEQRKVRAKGLYHIDDVMPLKKSQDNPTIVQIYNEWLESPASEKAHHALHTHYGSRRRLTGLEMADKQKAAAAKAIEVSVCIGTNCYLKGSYDVLQKLIALAKARGVADKVTFKGTFCMENCACGPSVRVGVEAKKFSVTEATAEAFFNENVMPRLAATRTEGARA